MLDEREDVVDEVEEDEEDEAPETPVLSLVLAMEDRVAPPLVIAKFDPEWSAEYFIAAKAPRSEAEVTKGASKTYVEDFSPEMNRADRRRAGKKTVATDGKQALIAEFDEDKWFLEKCYHQITDFRLRGKKGHADSKYDDAKNGRNSNNETIYRAFLRPDSAEFRWLLESYLDWVGGRTTGDRANELDRQFKILGNVPEPQPNGS
jgi:hypothetical protein